MPWDLHEQEWIRWIVLAHAGITGSPGSRVSLHAARLCGRVSQFSHPAARDPPKSSGVGPFAGKIPAAGNTVGVSKDGTEWALDVGAKTDHEFLIELKKT